MTRRRDLGFAIVEPVWTSITVVLDLGGDGYNGDTKHSCDDMRD